MVMKLEVADIDVGQMADNFMLLLPQPSQDRACFESAGRGQENPAFTPGHCHDSGCDFVIEILVQRR